MSFFFSVFLDFHAPEPFLGACPVKLSSLTYPTHLRPAVRVSRGGPFCRLLWFPFLGDMRLPYFFPRLWIKDNMPGSNRFGQRTDIGLKVSEGRDCSHLGFSGPSCFYCLLPGLLLSVDEHTESTWLNAGRLFLGHIASSSRARRVLFSLTILVYCISSGTRLGSLQVFSTWHRKGNSASSNDVSSGDRPRISLRRTRLIALPMWL